MKILHVLDHYKPHFSGYVFRTSYILKYQRENGLEPVCITSPKQGEAGSEKQEIDNVKIYGAQKYNFGNTPFLKEIKLMQSMRKRIEEIIRIENPDIIHAHSPSLNGIPALNAGRKYGIPVVYEVRAFWEDAAVDHRTFKEKSFKYRISRFIETRLFKKVDAIFTISEGMKIEIISRGIPDEKITIIPNGVDIEKFSFVEYDNNLAKQLMLDGRNVLGYIGSFYHYEGIDLLIDAFAKILKKNKDVVLLLVGDGPEYKKIRKMAEEKGINESVIFTGMVKHNEINNYYSLMDIIIYPRKSMKLTELVTPLKPLEAMAIGKAVAGSDVGGIRELIRDGKNGVLFKPDNIESLTEKLLGLLANPGLRENLSHQAVMHVSKERNWHSIIQKYLPVYESVLKSRN